MDLTLFSPLARENEAGYQDFTIDPDILLYLMYLQAWRLDISRRNDMEGISLHTCYERLEKKIKVREDLRKEWEDIFDLLPSPRTSSILEHLKSFGLKTAFLQHREQVKKLDCEIFNIFVNLLKEMIICDYENKNTTPARSFKDSRYLQAVINNPGKNLPYYFHDVLCFLNFEQKEVVHSFRDEKDIVLSGELLTAEKRMLLTSNFWEKLSRKVLWS